MRTGDEKVVPLELSDETSVGLVVGVVVGSCDPTAVGLLVPCAGTSAGLVVGVVVGSCDPTAVGLLVPCADVLCILVFDQKGRRMALKKKSVQNRYKN